ncbi:CoA-disulfide reductase [Chengkuizengella axinellae]|uniref:CoA-disulfide reductase n=1 Tax=Chengkuizengella axinellae TaxID=3064388 RepID=A0ABT9J000_9BACL|nr:CoA-disulfide reductase [Chengkuizengella sp. 2205SS18-9]MDP5274943.1 CoA-disulfide reductase [Chengkuizengella sp. 2205SS18-9]
MGKKVLIVGGVAGGASAAARLRRLDETTDIIMFEKGEFISFANCGLPYFIGETIQERSKLLVTSPEMMKNRFNIDVRVFSEVIKVDAVNKKVTINSPKEGQYEETFDNLILSPGAKPFIPNISGIDSKKIYSLRNVPDTDRIKKAVDQQNTGTAIIVGGGYIGVEMAESLIQRGIEVTLLENAPHILSPFDSDMVAHAEKEMQEQGVQLMLNQRVEAFQDDEDKITAYMKDGNKLTADIVIMAIGVVPDTAFLQNSNIKLGQNGHIIVDDSMQTSVESIYAVGDAVEVKHFVHQQNTAIPLAGPANKQGRIVADQICGIPTKYKGTQGTSIIKIFDITGACTGLNERNLNQVNIPYKVVHVHPLSHAGYYPGAKTISLKLIFKEDGKILGAQAFGVEGVDKRIDVIATAMRLGGTINDLTELELSYAPPYSSAKDPVNMAGYVAENVLTNKTEVFVIDELEKIRNQTSTILIDVRTEQEFNKGSIEGAIHIPVDELRERKHELDPNKQLWVYCQVGLRGHVASRILKQEGFKVKNLTGGYKSYDIANFEPS